MKLLNINDFASCSFTWNVNDIYNIKVCFWMQTIYFDTCLNSKRAVCSLENCIYHLDTFFQNFVLIVKYGVVV